MASLAYRHMNFTLHELERIEWAKQAAWYASLPAEVKAEKTSYWFLERKSKNGKRWIYVRDYVGTKKEAAAFFCKYFRDGKHRLRHLLTY